MIPIALLTEIAEVAEILTDLRGCIAQTVSELKGRDPLYTIALEIAEFSQIFGKSADRII